MSIGFKQGLKNLKSKIALLTDLHESKGKTSGDSALALEEVIGLQLTEFCDMVVEYKAVYVDRNDSSLRTCLQLTDETRLTKDELRAMHLRELGSDELSSGDIMALSDVSSVREMVARYASLAEVGIVDVVLVSGAYSGLEKGHRGVFTSEEYAKAARLAGEVSTEDADVKGKRNALGHATCLFAGDTTAPTPSTLNMLGLRLTDWQEMMDDIAKGEHPDNSSDILRLYADMARVGAVDVVIVPEVHTLYHGDLKNVYALGEYVTALKEATRG